MAHYGEDIELKDDSRRDDDNTGDNDTAGETNFTDTFPEVPKNSPGEPGSLVPDLTTKNTVGRAVDQYYRELQKMGFICPDKLDYDKFSLKDVKIKGGRTVKALFLGDKRLTSLDDGRPLAEVQNLQWLQKTLGITHIPLPAEAAAKFKQTNNTLSAAEDAADSIELQELPQVATDVINSVERALTEPEIEKALASMNPPLELRELRGLDKVMQTIRGELTNNLAKLSELDKEIAHQKVKVEESQSLDDSIRKREVQILRNLEDERAARLEVASANRTSLRSQINRIRETISRLLNEDTTLGERLRTLFREQGITIASILTALSMVISTLVLAFTGGGGVAATPPAPPADKGGIKEWVKQRLQDLGRLLGKLADKAAAALPGIIGSIVSWLLSTAQKAVGWLAENLWALIVGVAGLVYLMAKDYMFLRLAKPKKD